MNVSPKLKLLMPVMLIALVGCMHGGYKHEAPIDEGASPPTGAALVAGDVRIKTRAGEVRKGSDATVYLVPATPYSTEWFDRSVVNGDKIDGKDPRSFLSTRAALVDDEGRFEFRGVSAGAYYLVCKVHYERPGFRMGRLTFRMRSIETVEAYASIDVMPEEKVEVIVTRPPA
jgi:hypothetical protein